MDKRAWNLKISNKIALGYLMILLMLGIFLFVVSARITSLEQETVFLSEHDMQVHELTFQIEKNMLDMETGQRGYALTGESTYLEPYNNGIVEWRINYAKLYRLIGDSPEQRQNLNSIKENIELWIDEAGNYIVDLKRGGRNEAVNAFFSNDTGKPIVDSIRKLSDHFRENERKFTEARISGIKDSNDKLLITMYVLWTLVALLAALVTYLISSSIVKPLRSIIQAINNIAGGSNMSERISVRTMDEIYDLGSATNRLLDTVQREQWSSEQLTNMSIALQETTDLSIMCSTFMDKLSLILEMQYGTIFVLDPEGKYKRKYTYAGGASGFPVTGTDTVKLGEGLLGQCALDMRLRLIDDLPVDYISINSGLGRTAPRFAVVAPIVFENRTVAVLEAASLSPWQPHHIKLLNELLNIMGVTVNSVITRMEIQNLYQESQVMNEELQVQSEELQVQTEELQSHTKELLILNEELENQKSVVENSAAQLEKYNEQLELSSRYKSEFLANMSHELRTPLNSMLILSQLLAENRNETLSEEEQGYAAVIYSSGTDLLGLINDILDLSKVEAGKMLVEKDAVNLTELPSILVSFFDKTAEQRNLDFSVSLGKDVPDMFFTDEMRLHQILRNLLANAFKFTEEGFVRVEINFLASYSDPQYQVSDPVLAFSVIDSGIGISARNRELIFEAFRQADGSTARRFGGTGLGLSISLQLARLLGGHIAVQSEEGKGSTFTLYLPCREEEYEADTSLTDFWAQAAPSREQNEVLLPPLNISAARDPGDKEIQKLRGRSVLIVDDDVRNIFALQKALETCEMKILTAQSGYECLQVVRENPDLDMVLLDIMMPNLDGYDTLSIIREELLMSELPIIAISAKTMKEDRERCLAAGATDFISKPVVMQDVVNRICRWIRPANA